MKIIKQSSNSTNFFIRTFDFLSKTWQRALSRFHTWNKFDNHWPHGKQQTDNDNANTNTRKNPPNAITFQRRNRNRNRIFLRPNCPQNVHDTTINRRYNQNTRRCENLAEKVAKTQKSGSGTRRKCSASGPPPAALVSSPKITLPEWWDWAGAGWWTKCVYIDVCDCGAIWRACDDDDAPLWTRSRGMGEHVHSRFFFRGFLAPFGTVFEKVWQIFYVFGDGRFSRIFRGFYSRI